MGREEYVKIPMGQQKNIVLVAHDNKKQDLLEWTRFNRELLLQHKLYATGTTGLLLEAELGLDITKLHTGPSGAIFRSVQRSPKGPSIF